MSVYTFKPLAHDIANEAWRPLDRALYSWVTVHGGSPLLAQTAAWASVADGEGDTAVSLGGAGTARHEMPVLTPEQVAQLRAQPMVSDGQGGVLTPFVLDADGRFYLWRNHQHERAAVVPNRVAAVSFATRNVAKRVHRLEFSKIDHVTAAHIAAD